MAAAPGHGNDEEEAVDFGDPLVIAVTPVEIKIAAATLFVHLGDREDPAKPRPVWCLDGHVHVESRCHTPSSPRQTLADAVATGECRPVCNLESHHAPDRKTSTITGRGVGVYARNEHGPGVLHPFVRLRRYVGLNPSPA